MKFSLLIFESDDLDLKGHEFIKSLINSKGMTPILPKEEAPKQTMSGGGPIVVDFSSMVAHKPKRPPSEREKVVFYAIGEGLDYLENHPHSASDLFDHKEVMSDLLNLGDELRDIMAVRSISGNSMCIYGRRMIIKPHETPEQKSIIEKDVIVEIAKFLGIAAKDWHHIAERFVCDGNTLSMYYAVQFKKG
jgi:hypothetical protein